MDEVQALATTDEDKRMADAIAGVGDVELEITDPDTIAREIVERILTAPDEDAVSRQGQATPAQQVLGQPFTLRGVRFLQSAYAADRAGNAQVYCLLDVADADGTPGTITCGSRNVMAQALRLKMLDAFPTRDAWRIIPAERPTQQGFYPLWLEKVA